MAQRATLGEKSVYAYQVDDEAVWSGLITSYRAKQLRLPCCGACAIPKEHASGTRYFAHLPYEKKACKWKATGQSHEQILGEVCKALRQQGWDVDTDIWIDGVACDVVAHRPDFLPKLALFIELASERDRPEAVVLAEVQKVREIPGYTCFGFTTSGSLADTGNWAWKKLPLDENAIPTIYRSIGSVTRRLRRAGSLHSMIFPLLNESGWRPGLIQENGLTARIEVRDPVSGEPFAISIDEQLDPALPPLEKPGSSERDATRARLADLFKSRLEVGTELWWDDFPKLTATSFKRLQDAIADGEHAGIMSDTNWRPWSSSAGGPTDRKAQITRLAVDWLGSEEGQAWLVKKNKLLDGDTPLAAAEGGASAYFNVQDLLRAKVEEQEDDFLK